MVFSNYNTTINATVLFGKVNEGVSEMRNDWTSFATIDLGGSRATALASSAVLSGMADTVGSGTFSKSSGSRTVDFYFDMSGRLDRERSLCHQPDRIWSSCCNLDTASVNGNASFSNFLTGGSSTPFSNVSFSLDGTGNLTSKSGNLVFDIAASEAGNWVAFGGI